MAQAVLDQLAAQGVKAAGLALDSREISRGEVFVACPGAKSDGRDYIDAAVARGAAAVLWERAGFAWDARHVLPNLGVEGLRECAGYLAHLVSGRPSERLRVVGVTGTNGKTSVCHWIARSLDAVGRRCALVGTLGSGFPGALAEALNTTPDAIHLHRALAQFAGQGASACAMEVSSIGLDQGRVNGVRFDTAVFTNLTRDHLEYHGSMEAYAQAKARLFALPGLAHAVINLDDAFGRALAASLKGSGAQRIGYTLARDGQDRPAVDALLHARELSVTPSGLRFVAVTPRGEAEVQARLAGRFNVSNLLAVLAALLACDVPLAEAARALCALTPPHGRMQMHGGAGEPLVVVDYAHTPDALEQALIALRETARARGGQLACVFGCGGERDPGKRPEMGEVASRHADRVLLTSDNPRGESPAAILAQIAAGAARGTEIVEDRAEAIAAAIACAAPEDLVLIAGKGHEAYQEIAGVRHAFSDAEHVQRALAARRERRS